MMWHALRQSIAAAAAKPDSVARDDLIVGYCSELAVDDYLGTHMDVTLHIGRGRSNRYRKSGHGVLFYAVDPAIRVHRMLRFNAENNGARAGKQ